MVKGKAIIYVEKDTSYWSRFHTDVKMQSCSADWDARSYIRDDLEDVIPNCAENLKDGERLWVAVKYTVHYSQDYFGEWDTDVEFTSERILKRRPPKKPRYISKANRRL